MNTFPHDETHRQRWYGYYYPGSNVLKNRLGIHDVSAWDAAETDLVASRTQSLPDFGFDTEHISDEIKAIHHHLFQDCYDWAGEYRTVNMSKPHPDLQEPITFLSWQTIEENLDIIQDQIALTNWDDMTTGGKIDALAIIHGELNSVHPFREGNGRVTRSFMEILAARHDISLDWTDAEEGLHLVSAVSMTHESGLDTSLWKAFYGQIAQQAVWQDEALEGFDDVFDVLDKTHQPATDLLDALGISPTGIHNIHQEPVAQEETQQINSQEFTRSISLE